MNKEDIKNLLKDLYFSVNEEQLDFIYEQFMSIYSSITYLKDVDVSGVEPADWPFKVSTTFLREDEVNHLLSNEQVLKNAANAQDAYIKYIKVV